MYPIYRRAALHYVVSLQLILLYGIQVCPFLEGLTLVQLGTPVLIIFVAMYGLRSRLLVRGGDHRNGFFVELSLFLLGGVLWSLYNGLLYDFPMESHLKILLGMLTLGFLVAAELSLQREWLQARECEAKAVFELSGPIGMPLTRKFSLFTLATLALLGAVFFLVFNKDIEWLAANELPLPRQTAQALILFEVAFVMATAFAYLWFIIRAYGRNLTLTLGYQTRTMARVRVGDLDARVPVARDDEFGLIAAGTNQMISELKARRDELNLTRDVAILGLASLAETRDNETGAHIIRTQHYVKVLADYLRHLDWDRYPLDDDTLDLLFKSAPLHDVGKVGIPDAILLKPGKLTDEEFAIMKRHPQIGADALASAEAQLGSNSFLRLAREIALTHHEKWDGSGYPAGLVGEAIPLSGRLMAIADVYDALISARVYKPAFSHEEAREIIVRGRGSHFDPALVDAFLACEDQFCDIASRHRDSH
ncbi:HD domain-containing phosphohydrolase [Aeromonas diversa]|uniref:HD domain-containing phosphohydrolase n=1 Tax=Aeromonas diversa TaxID=502790 RepID=UPI003463532C